MRCRRRGDKLASGAVADVQPSKLLRSDQILLCARERGSSSRQSRKEGGAARRRLLSGCSQQPTGDWACALFPPPQSEQPPRMAKSWEVLSRCSFPPAAPAMSCHASHRSHLCQVSRVNSSFSSVIVHKTRNKKGSRALLAAEYHHIGLHSPACNSKCAAGSPT